MKSFINTIIKDYKNYLQTTQINLLQKALETFNGHYENIKKELNKLPVDKLISVNHVLLNLSKKASLGSEKKQLSLDKLTIAKTIFELINETIEKIPPWSLEQRLGSQQLHAKYGVAATNFLILDLQLNQIKNKEVFLEMDKKSAQTIQKETKEFHQQLTRQYKAPSLQKTLNISQDFIDRVQKVNKDAHLALVNIKVFLRQQTSQQDTASIASVANTVQNQENAQPVDTQEVKADLSKKRKIQNENTPPVKYQRIRAAHTSVHSQSLFTTRTPLVVPESTLPSEKIECLKKAFAQIIPDKANPQFLANLAGILGNFFHYQGMHHQFRENINYLIANEFYNLGLSFVPHYPVVTKFQESLLIALRKNTQLISHLKLSNKTASDENTPLKLEKRKIHGQQVFLDKIEEIFDEINALFATDSQKFLKIIKEMTDYFIKTIQDKQLVGSQSNQIMEDFSHALKQPVKNFRP